MGTSSKLYTLNNAIFCLDKGVHFIDGPFYVTKNYISNARKLKPKICSRSF